MYCIMNNTTTVLSIIITIATALRDIISDSEKSDAK